MRRTLFLGILALVVLLAFTTIAGAKYAGYAGSSLRYDGAAMNPSVLSNAPGYMSWGTAKAQMTARGITNARVLATPHGGYAIATSKCAVCHSGHRALGKAGIPNTVTGASAEGMTLTAGANSCVECHTEWGSVGTGLPVEWAQTNSGPHGSNACATCHLGGIHGAGTSQFHGMNAFMLGGVNDAQIAAETAPGPTGNYDPEFQDPTAINNDSGWFWNGTIGPRSVGGTPIAMPVDSWARNRQILTGYTCSRTGCHTNSALSVGYWGWAGMREQRDATNSFNVLTTGHKASPGSLTEIEGAYCGPCHPGNPAGGYRVLEANPTGIAGSGPVVGGVPQGTRSLNNARQYGCDQCHDMVGVLTNSTAFPHANRNIAVYEWNATGVKTIISNQSAGNLWMYAANTSSTGPINTFPLTYVDQSMTVINNAVASGVTIGQWKDGACLKCHVPIDGLSATLAGKTGLRSQFHDPANLWGSWSDFPGYSANGRGLEEFAPYLFK